MGFAQHSRQAWIEASGLCPGLLEPAYHQILAKLHENKRLGRESTILLDLDSTLYEVAPRTVQILREACGEMADCLPEALRAAVQRLETAGYSLEDSLGEALTGASDSTREALHAFWRSRFFSDAYLIHDRPYPGTAAFARELHSMGARIVYLTGRDEPGMKEGTLANLARDGFPVGPGTQLVMKDRRETDDVVHKVGAAKKLAAEAPIIASFENEPRNFAALCAAFPDAVHVFVDTVCSNHPAPAVPGAWCIRQF